MGRPRPAVAWPADFPKDAATALASSFTPQTGSGVNLAILPKTLAAL